MTSTASAPNVAPAEPGGKASARSVTVPPADLKVIDVAASLSGSNRSAYMVKHTLAAAEADLKRNGIDPDTIRKSA